MTNPLLRTEHNSDKAPEINPYCETTQFRRDLSELCKNCRLQERINRAITNQIIFQAKDQKDILTDSQFADYCKNEIENAQGAMMRMNLNMRKHENDSGYVANIPNTTEIFIFNKERIKALNSLQNTTTPPPKKERDPAKARRAVTSFESRLEELIKQENGKNNPKPDETIVKEAIAVYLNNAGKLGFGETEKSLKRYLEDIGNTQTVLEYGRQFVRQNRNTRH